MRPSKLILVVSALVLGLSACGANNPPGTISEDDLPSSVEVKKVRHDRQAGQVICSDANDTEDNHLMISVNADPDREAAVAYELSGSHYQGVSNSVWRLLHPREAVDMVAAGVDKCVQAQPEVYRRFDVKGYPDALGYSEEGGSPTPSYTRRILVPLDDRVVIVTSRRQGGDDFKVAPEDVLKKAIAASGDAPDW